MLKQYRVAGHVFSFSIAGDSPFWPLIDEAYQPFFIASDQISLIDAPLFSLVETESLPLEHLSMEKIFEQEAPDPGYVKMTIYRYESGYYLECTQWGSQAINGRLLLTDNGQVSMQLSGSFDYRWMTFTTATQVAFILYAALLDTLMVHASSILYKGKGYLFLGKSGTGKSTHSRLWLQAIESCCLLNDDHPVVRIGQDGTPWVYGSPWSGKTKCYKNLQAPLGGVVRIRRESFNKMRRLSPIEAYGSLMTSCSGFPLAKRLCDGKSRSLQSVVAKVASWELSCLPQPEAALCCREALLGNDIEE